MESFLTTQFCDKETDSMTKLTPVLALRTPGPEMQQQDVRMMSWRKNKSERSAQKRRMSIEIAQKLHQTRTNTAWFCWSTLS